VTALRESARSAPPPDRGHLLHEIQVCGGWALSTYARCDFRCVYCITGAQGVSSPLVSRTELPNQLRNELAPLGRDVHISVGAICDAYPPAEAHHEVTRRALQVLVADGRHVTVITKGTLVLRDRDLLAKADARVRVSLCAVDERALKRVDPKAPTAAERLSVIGALADSGITVSVSAAPWIPGVSDIAALLERVPPGVPVCVAPLNVSSPEVAATPYGRRFSQRAVNEAYIDEFERVGPRPFVDWVRPIRVDASEPEFHPFATLRAPPQCSMGEARHPFRTEAGSAR
jgi:Radical SAM superfamily